MEGCPNCKALTAKLVRYSRVFDELAYLARLHHVTIDDDTFERELTSTRSAVVAELEEVEGWRLVA